MRAFFAMLHAMPYAYYFAAIALILPSLSPLDVLRFRRRSLRLRFFVIVGHVTI